MDITRKIIFTLLAMFCIAGGGYLGSQGLVAVPGFAFASGGLFLFVGFLKEFKHFKASLTTGIEAETREVVREAKDVINELRKMALLFSGMSLKGIKSAGRLGGNPNRESEEIKDSLIGLLKDLGATDDEVTGILSKTWWPFIEGDYVYRILHDIPQRKLNPEQRALWENLFKRGALGGSSSPEQLRNFLSGLGEIQNEKENLLNDYEYFLKTRTVRNPEFLDIR